MNDHVMNSTDVISQRTYPAKPGKPNVHSVTQVGQNININWTKPGQANGLISMYIIKVYELPHEVAEKGSSYNIRDVGLTKSPVYISQSEGLSYVVDGSILRPRAAYVFTVQAKNELYVGDVGLSPVIVYDSSAMLQKIRKFIHKTVENTSVTLQWEKLDTKEENGSKGQQRGYKIGYKPYDKDEVPIQGEIQVHFEENPL